MNTIIQIIWAAFSLIAIVNCDDIVISSYSSVRFQKANNAAEPQVGSKMAEEILANPVLANEPPELESPFIKQLKNIQHMDVANMDKIITGETFDFAQMHASHIRSQDATQLDPSESDDIEFMTKLHVSRSIRGGAANVDNDDDHTDDDMADEEFDDDHTDDDKATSAQESNQEGNDDIEMDQVDDNKMDNVEEKEEHESTPAAKEDNSATDEEDENKLKIKPIHNYKIRPVDVDE